MKQLFPLAVILFLASCSNPESSVYKVNESASKVEWKGSAPDHYHVGSFKITGSLQADKQGRVSSGDFTIPIASIEDYDLKSANFFNLVLHPDATFHVTKAEPYTGKDTGAVAGANYVLTGDFSMVGQAHSISFPAKISNNENGISAEASFNIDRTKWGMTIYSDPTQKLYILPDVNIHLNVQTEDSKLAKL